MFTGLSIFKTSGAEPAIYAEKEVVGLTPGPPIFYKMLMPTSHNGGDDIRSEIINFIPACKYCFGHILGVIGSF